MAIDPGGSTGVAMWPACWTDTIDEYMHVVPYVLAYNVDIVVCERFVLRGPQFVSDAKAPMSIIGALEHEASHHKSFELVMQDPYVRRAGDKQMHVFKPLATDHEKDAAKHLLAYLTFNPGHR